MENDMWSTLIEKLMIWRGNLWTKYESKLGKLTLRIHYDQLLISSDTKVLESFNLNCKMKGAHKENIFILIVSVNAQEIRKLKFQIKTDVAQCLYKLSEHFPVMEHNSLQSKNTALAKYQSIEEVLKRALVLKESLFTVPLPPNYGNFIKLCLLDPTFTQSVLETNNILQQEILRK